LSIEAGPADYQPHTITTHFDELAKALLVGADICEAYDPSDAEADTPEHRKVIALWDTGATISVISEETADQLDLFAIGKIYINHADGQIECNTYIVNLYLDSQIEFPGVVVACSHLPGIDMLIGMDVITQGDFTIANVEGKTVFSYSV
jgi:hypothetical protein